MITKEIPFEIYKGEEVVVKTIIRKGKKIKEKKFYADNVKAIPKGNAYIIGNGPSRKNFDLNKLKDTGQTYGCNALYRDFIPDYIFSVDTKITKTMIKDKVYEKCWHYTPSLEVNRYPPHLQLIPNNPGWISGSAAFWTATVHGHKNIYLIGFDFQEYGKNKLNNIYQDTKHYGPRDSDHIFQGWLDQWRQVQHMRPYCNFNIVHDNVPEFLTVSNPSANLNKFKIYTYQEFNDIVLNRTF
tara:strand:+ start:102 stop:824 length:723 start_codon:yes stop_codon:yes gene_type:complete